MYCDKVSHILCSKLSQEIIILCADELIYCQGLNYETLITRYYLNIIFLQHGHKFLFHFMLSSPKFKYLCTALIYIIFLK